MDFIPTQPAYISSNMRTLVSLILHSHDRGISAKNIMIAEPELFEALVHTALQLMKKESKKGRNK